MSNVKAPEGKLWVCTACGKTARWKYGFLDDGTPKGGPIDQEASPGWDVSCTMNSQLHHTRLLVRGPNGRVTEIQSEEYLKTHQNKEAP